MRIHDRFHKIAILYVSELLFSFIFCPLTFVFLQAMFFSYKAALIMFGVISTLYSFILCRTFDYCFSCGYTKVIY